MTSNNSEKRIILVNSLQFGGGEKIAGLVAQTAAVPLYTLHEKIEISVDSSLIKTDLNSRKKGLFSLFTAARKLAAITKQENIDIVQSHLINANLVNCMSRLFGAKHHIELVHHGMYSQRKREGLKGLILRILMKLFYNRGQRNIFVSKSCKNDYLAAIPKLKNPEVIYNPFDIADILNKAKRDIPEGNSLGSYFVYVGRLEKIKQLDVLLHAYAVYRTSGGKHNLVLIGEGAENAFLRELCTELSIAEYVHFLGTRDNPFAYIKHAHALVLTSVSETFSNTVMEAIIVGTSVISTRCGGPDELLCFPKISTASGIEKCRFGTLVDVGSSKQLAEAMAEIHTPDENKDICVEVDVNKLVNAYKRCIM